MNTTLFDTYAEIQRLRASGIDEEQAKAITRTVSNGVTGGVATKADIAELKGEIGRIEATLRSEIGGIEATLRGEIGELRGETGRIEATLKGEIGALRAELKWLNIVTCGTFLAVIGGVIKVAFFP